MHLHIGLLATRTVSVDAVSALLPKGRRSNTKKKTKTRRAGKEQQKQSIGMGLGRLRTAERKVSKSYVQT